MLRIYVFTALDIQIVYGPRTNLIGLVFMVVMVVAVNQRSNMKPIRIYVREEDIAHGYKASSRDCPIALAIKRKAKTTSVCVDRDSCRIRINGTKMKFRLPPTAQRFIQHFDNLGVVTPFSFRIMKRYFV